MDENREKRALAAAHFLRLPSLAERVLGRQLSIRPDPRAIGEMQDGIEGLRPAYEQDLCDDLERMMDLIVPACESYGPPRDRLHAIAHDARGMAGTFGFALLGRVAHSLCDYLELGKHRARLDSALVSLHVTAMQNALAGRTRSSTFEDAIVRQLEMLVTRALARAKERKWR